MDTRLAYMQSDYVRDHVKLVQMELDFKSILECLDAEDGAD